MQDEANQAGVGEDRGLEGGREHGEMAGAAEGEGFSSGGAGQKDDSTAGGGLQEGGVCNVQAGTQRGVLLQAVDVTGSEMCDYEKVHPLTVDPLVHPLTVDICVVSLIIIDDEFANDL